VDASPSVDERWVNGVRGLRHGVWSGSRPPGERGRVGSPPSVPGPQARTVRGADHRLMDTRSWLVARLLDSRRSPVGVQVSWLGCPRLVECSGRGPGTDSRTRRTAPSVAQAGLTDPPCGSRGSRPGPRRTNTGRCSGAPVAGAHRARVRRTDRRGHRAGYPVDRAVRGRAGARRSGGRAGSRGGSPRSGRSPVRWRTTARTGWQDGARPAGSPAPVGVVSGRGGSPTGRGARRRRRRAG
jgi:hypothetical protein